MKNTIDDVLVLGIASVIVRIHDAYDAGYMQLQEPWHVQPCIQAEVAESCSASLMDLQMQGPAEAEGSQQQAVRQGCRCKREARQDSYGLNSGQQLRRHLAADRVQGRHRLSVTPRSWRANDQQPMQWSIRSQARNACAKTETLRQQWE